MDKQFMERIAAEAENLTIEQKAYILGAARGMGLRNNNSETDTQPEPQQPDNTRTA